MNITSYPISYIKYNQPTSRSNQPIYKHTSFTSSVRSYQNKIKTLVGSEIYTTTMLFRDDLSFNSLADYAIKHFADKSKVNIYCLAGSDGSEAYSLAIALMERIPKSLYNKFFPIISIDRDSKIIESAQSGRINLTPKDLEHLKEHTLSNKDYFINPKEMIDIDGNRMDSKLCKSYEPIPELRSAVKFAKGDLVAKIAKMKDDGNSIILCRNVLPYLNSDEISNISYDIDAKLKRGSIFAIGNFDKNTKIRKYLNNFGFNEILKNVFEHY